MDEDFFEPSLERIKALGYKPQKELVYNKLLPYADELDEESSKSLAEIKLNLGKALMMREMKPACGIWVVRLARYIQLYGLKFSKEDHIVFVKLLYECVTIPNLEPYNIQKYANVLNVLLRKKLLSPDDITLEWRPLYEVITRTMESSLTTLGIYRYAAPLEHTLSNLVHTARFFFPDSATKEILEEFKPYIYPISGEGPDFEVFEWFLPIALPPQKAHIGYQLWFKSIMDMLTTCHNAATWEDDAMGLVSKLAWHNRGYIDWEPYIPDMFSRFMACFNLPVKYKNFQIKKMRKLDVTSITTWIVSVLGGGSECQKYLEHFLKAVETYFHPANSGRWTLKLKELLCKLPQTFVRRLQEERHKKVTWLTPTADSHRLTEEDIDKFVDSFKSVALKSVFSRNGIDVCIAVRELANLRPNAICPDLIEMLYLNLDSVTEPHKLTSVMQCVAAVAWPMVKGPEMGYTEGPLHVIPILMATLPGIDPNDFRKCIVTFNLIQSFANMVPIVDCSKASETWTDLTEDEEELCRQSAGFEDFVCQFLDRIFLMIESSSMEKTRLDKDEDKRSHLENYVEKSLTSVCASVLIQSSPQIFQAALKKFSAFVLGRLFEIKVAGCLVASLCSAFALVNAQETFKAMVPQICNTILRLTDSEDILNEHDLDEELLYKLLILSALVQSKNEVLLNYVSDVTAVLDRCLFLVSREGYDVAAKILKNILYSITVSASAVEHRCVNYEFSSDLTDHLPIRDWGKPGDLANLNLTWHTPSDAKHACAESLIHRFLVPELNKIKAHISGDDLMTRTRLLTSLHIINAVQGADHMLPFWQEEPLVLMESCLPISQRVITFGVKHEINMPDGSNVRLAIVNTLDNLQMHILETTEDDTKALLLIIKILERIMLNKIRCGQDYEGQLKYHTIVKKSLSNHLFGVKRRLRTMIVERVAFQHISRCEKFGLCLTPTHRLVMLNLLKLACSHYSQVRTAAQSSISKALDFFPYSYSVLLPDLLKNLKLNPIEAHEKIKGSLYVILGPKLFPFLTRHDWSLLSELWPALVRCQPSEKLSVVQLMDCVKNIVPKLFPTITLTLDIPDRCVDIAKELWNHAPHPPLNIVSEEEIEQGRLALLKRNEKNKQLYLSLLDTLCDAAEDNSLHWRHHSLAIAFITELIHPDILYTPRVVKIFLETLISDSIELRKVAIRSVVHILKQQKRQHPKIDVDANTLSLEPWTGEGAPGIRPDNKWLQYKYSTRPLSAKEWDTPRYHHEMGFCYLYTPRILKLYAPTCDQPNLDRSYTDMLPEEKPIVDFFTNEANIAKLMNYLSLEEKKGNDKFNGFRFILFKSLFRNYGDTFLPYFKSYLDKLVEDKQESSQRCATEIIAGLIRGSKHWPYDKIEKLWQYLVPLVQKALLNMTEETLVDWGICFATASQNRDPNRIHWLLECLMMVPLRNETSFKDSGRLYILQSALNQQEWRVAELSHRLLAMITPYLDHSYENVRTRIASVLSNIFQSDITLPGGKTIAPSVQEFMNLVESKLQILYTLSDSEFEHKNKKPKVNITTVTDALADYHLASKVIDKAPNGIINQDNETDAAIRLFKTVLQWISGALLRCNSGVLVEYYVLYPLMCLFESYDQDIELSQICSKTLSSMACVPLTAQVLPYAITVIQKVAASESWWARYTNLDFLQAVYFHSMFVLRSQSEYAAAATRVVLTALKDSRVEVREKAGEVLAGLIHCDFIEDTNSLLDTFSSDLDKSSRRHNRDAAKLVIRHSAILGLCAFVNSSPYDVPDCVPHIFYLLRNHLNDQQPIPSTIRKTLGDFKRTHYDNWESHKLKFTESQLEVFDDLTVPPAYCV